MTTGPPPRDDHYQADNGRPARANGPGHPGDDPLGARRARLAGFWALVLRRFRGYAQGSGGAAAKLGRDEGDR
jgi:hypothetical protein